MNNDKDLFRQALQRQNERAERMKMPDDMEQRVMQRVSSKKTNRRWLYSAIAAVAASILLLLVFRFNQEPVEEQPVVAETTEQSHPQPASQPIVEEKKEVSLAEVQPTKQPVKKRRKTVRKQSAPIEETEPVEIEQPIQYQTIQTVHLSSDVVVHIIEASDMPTVSTVPSVSELRARGLRLTDNVRQASQPTVLF